MEQRQADLDKVKNLEGRIDKEMQTQKEKIDEMKDEMENKFTRVDEMKEEFAKEKIRLAALKNLLQVYKPGLSMEVTYHSMKHDTKKNQILQSDIYTRLNELEKRLVQNESQIYAIQQYIESREAEYNYQAQLQECMHISSEINMDLVKKALSIQ